QLYLHPVLIQDQKIYKLLYSTFSLNRQPPRSPLFPYPTLFRSWRTSSRARWKPKVRSRHTSRRTENQPAWMPRLCSRLWRIMSRSEEHTSELQSRENLVCRLLLEKKKTKDKPQVKPDDEPH